MAATFSLKILNPKHVVFEGPVQTLFLPGDAGEFELLAYHVPIISLLKEGEIVIDWKTRIPIRRGMVRYADEQCVILLEEQSAGKPEKKAKEEGHA